MPEPLAPPSHPERTTAAVTAPREGWLVVLLVLLRLPFFWTEHLQEDAFIAFRTAFNLADHGVLGFNVGERYAASTSLVYAYFCALMRWLTGAHAVPVILAVNAVLAALAVARLSRVFSLSGGRALAFALAVGCSNGALLPAFNGMETAWCLLYLALLAEHSGRTRIAPWAFGALLALGPLLRPDAVLLAAGAWLARQRVDASDRRRRAWGAVGLGLGLALLAGCNALHSGSWLPPSIVAKRVAYHPDLSPAAVLRRVWDVYLGGPFSLLPPTKYLPDALLAAASLTLWALLGLAVQRSRSMLHEARRPFLLLAGVAALFPLALAVPGALFPWYFHPASFALASCLVVGIQRGLLGAARGRWTAVALGLGALSVAGQLVLSLNTGRQESGYRASVGQYLAELARPGDTLVLEPAGIIPFYSGLTTFDEVGLTSARVLPFLSSGHPTWLAEFLHAVCPTFTVQRDAFPAPSPARPASDDERWFSQSYALRRRFVYVPDEWARGGLERWLLRHGRHSDYLVYERRAGVDCAARSSSEPPSAGPADR